MDHRLALAIGEEISRGTKEAATVGWVPLISPALPKVEFDDKPREEYRGESTVLGDRAIERMSRKWSHSFETPFFTEAGTTAGMIGTILKHCLGKVTSVQNAATGQYAHMLYPSADPFATANLGAKALTLNYTINEGTVMRNWPFVGGRVSSINFAVEPGNKLIMSADLFGQFRDAVTTEIGGQVFAAENLRCDYYNLSVYTGVITRVGVAPDYTDITFGSATRIKPYSISVKIENGMEDQLRIAGVDYPDKTTMGIYKVSVDLKLDWENPASGFSSVDDFNAWMAASSETNFCLHFDTGTPAGSGDNHSLIIDIPRCQRQGGEPDYSRDKDPLVSLTYSGLYDETTTKYIVGLLLKNAAVAI